VKRASTMKKKDTTMGTRCNQLQMRGTMKMRKPRKSNENRKKEREKDSPQRRCLQIVR
jgi:hypothetical protein